MRYVDMLASLAIMTVEGVGRSLDKMAGAWRYPNTLKCGLRSRDASTSQHHASPSHTKNNGRPSIHTQ